MESGGGVDGLHGTYVRFNITDHCLSYVGVLEGNKHGLIEWLNILPFFKIFSFLCSVYGHFAANFPYSYPCPILVTTFVTDVVQAKRYNFRVHYISQRDDV